MKPIDIYLAQKTANLLNKYLIYRSQANDPKIDPWEHLFSNGAESIDFKIDTKLTIKLYKDSKLSKLIYQNFEEDEKIFIKHFIRPQDIILDIGANIGLHTLYAANRLAGQGLVYAFEPTPQTYLRLEENIQHNNLQSVVKINPIGLSDQTGSLMLNITRDGYDAWNSFVQLKHVPIDDQVKVNVMSADDFIAQEQIDLNKISLIKIDVEGWEINVLDGMESLLKNIDFRGCLLIEFTEENMFRAGYSCRDLYRYMEELGYRWYKFDASSNQIAPEELKAYYPYENLIATKFAEEINLRLSEKAVL